MIETIVIGGGISGLSLAYYLKRAGRSIMLIESSDRTGGVIRSERKGNFLVEHGPNSTLAKLELRELANELSLELLPPSPNAKRRYLAKRTAKPKLIAAPESFLQAVSTPLLSLKGKLRVLVEPSIKRKAQPDESVSSFISRRAGREVAEEIVAPVLGGIWASDLTKLSTRSALPLLWSFEQEHGSILRGAFNYLKTKDRTPRGHLAAFRDGMAALPRALTSALGKDVILSSTVTKIWPTRDFVEVSFCSSSHSEQTIKAKRVILATPASATAQLTADTSPDFAHQLASLPYAPVGLLTLAFPAKEVGHAIDGFGFLVPPSLDYGLLGAVFSSALFAERAPKGYHLFTCFAGGGRSPELANVQVPSVKERIVKELCSLVEAHCPPEVIDESYCKEAIPNYPLNHFTLQQTARKFEQQFPSVRLLGAWDQGVSVADRCAAAKRLASELLT